MASSSTTTASEHTKSQYHHFIPRFILRNFAHSYQPPNGPARGSAKRDRRQRRGNNRRDEPMLYTLDLSKSKVAITETPVGRTFGLTDMYRDFANATNQHYLEEQLSKLESRAASIILKIRKAFEAGDKDVWLIRAERDILRKFLFIMKYRASRMHRRFYHEHAEGYHANDKEKLLIYMQERSFRRPVDVWFDNIKAMLEMKMDPEGHWMKELVERIYPDDAIWFIAHTQMMYLAFCTTSVADDEFLLTENAYAIHEGPTSFQRNLETGALTEAAYTEYHMFAVISPKLIMVLRSLQLPVPDEDSGEQIRNFWETMHQLSARQHSSPGHAAESVLADLPICKPCNSYSKTVEGRVVPLDGEDGTHRADHRFCFRFFPLETDHVNKIHTIMLEESTTISAIVFKSYAGARKIFEHYLSMPTSRSFKFVQNTPDDPRKILLEKLEEAAKQMGSNVGANYKTHEIGLDFEKNLPKEPTEFMQLYIKLGGSGRTIPKDLEQAGRMLNMRIKVDVWSQGLDERFRESIRDNVKDLFCQLPVRRVWYYLKMVRNMLLKGHVVDGLENSMFDEGPENVIVRVSHRISKNGIARLMWLTVMNHIQFVKNPYLDLQAKISLNAEVLMLLQGIRIIAFGQAGNICDCAIPEIEEKARSWKSVARTKRSYSDHKSPFLTEEENIELFTRKMIRNDLVDLLGKHLSAADLKDLERVLFTISYPIVDFRY